MPPDPPTAPRRRFSLLDMMILVAAIAPGLALSRVMIEKLPGYSISARPIESVLSAVLFSIGVGTPALLTMTPGLLLLRLRRPRRSGKRLWHSQGALQLVILSILVLVGGSAMVSLFFLSGVRFHQTYAIVGTVFLLPSLLASGSGAVVIASRLLGMRGRSLDWVDRLGRIWGWLWFVIAPLALYAII